MNSIFINWKFFLCIARERSFSKAAERLRITTLRVHPDQKPRGFLEVKLFERLDGVSTHARGKGCVRTRKKNIVDRSGLQNEIKGLKGNTSWTDFSGMQQGAERDPACRSQWPNSKRNTQDRNFHQNGTQPRGRTMGCRKRGGSGRH